MKFSHRLILGICGLFLIALTVAYLRRGIFSYANVGYRQATFSAGTIGSGIILVALAFLPPACRGIPPYHYEAQTPRSLSETTLV